MVGSGCLTHHPRHVPSHGKIDAVLEINKEIHALGYDVLYDGMGGQLDRKMEQSIRSIVWEQKSSPGIDNVI